MVDTCCFRFNPRYHVHTSLVALRYKLQSTRCAATTAHPPHLPLPLPKNRNHNPQQIHIIRIISLQQAVRGDILPGMVDIKDQSRGLTRRAIAKYRAKELQAEAWAECIAPTQIYGTCKLQHTDLKRTSILPFPSP
eukprot:5728477-Amphidinium_carterae.1